MTKAASFRKCYAVCVGINQYSPASGLHPLRYAESDALAFDGLLGRMGCSPRQRRLLLGDAATFEAIKASLIGFAANKPDPDDLVICYFAGYSLSLKTEQTTEEILLPPFDFDIQQARDNMAYRQTRTLGLDLLQQIYENSNSDRVLFIFDTYDTGTYTSENFVDRESRVKNWFRKVFAGETPGRTALSSCLPVEEALRDNGTGHGFFAYHLLQVLEGRARGAQWPDGCVTVRSMFDYLLQVMPEQYQPLMSNEELDRLELACFPVKQAQVQIPVMPEPEEDPYDAPTTIMERNGQEQKIFGPGPYPVADPLSDEESEDENEATVIASRPAEDHTGPVYEPLRFTLFYPGESAAEAWHSMLLYAHLASIRPEVENGIFTPDGSLPPGTPSQKMSRLARATRLKIVPEAEGVEFNPSSQTITWQEDLHRAEFRFKASDMLEGEICSGTVSIFVGPLEIGRVPFTLKVTDQTIIPRHSRKPDTVFAQGEMYRRIYPSFSHLDGPVLKSCQAAFKAIGDERFAELDKLRSGQIWNKEIERMIDEADSFQLFWSKNAAQSRYVQREWQYALLHSEEGENQTEFIRPFYWEQPRPPVPLELKPFHFRYVDIPGLVEEIPARKI